MKRLLIYIGTEIRARSDTGREIRQLLWQDCENILLNKEDCEECVNDTWLRAWNAMPDERPAILSAFLGAITRNLSLDRYRKLHTAKRGKGKWSLFLMN